MHMMKMSEITTRINILSDLHMNQHPDSQIYTYILQRERDRERCMLRTAWESVGFIIILQADGADPRLFCCVLYLHAWHTYEDLGRT